MSSLSTVLGVVVRMTAAAAKVPREAVHPDDTLAHLGVDSLGRMKLVAQLEARYEVTLPEEAAQGTATPGALAVGIAAARRRGAA